MKIKNVKKSLAFALCASSFSIIQAQESVNATGGNASGSGGSVSYSIGQMTYQEFSNASGTISQGVQKAFEISVVTEIKDSQVDIQLVAYPNPSMEQLSIQFDKTVEKSKYEVLDLNGKVVLNGELNELKTDIPMQNLSNATYFLSIYNNNTNIKTFRIVKN